MHRLISLIPIVLDDGVAVLCCPHCGSTATFPTSISCTPPGQMQGEVRIQDVGVLWDGKAESSRAGVRIELTFRCVEGHSFSMALRSHKTRTVVNRDLDPKDPPQQSICRN